MQVERPGGADAGADHALGSDVRRGQRLVHEPGQPREHVLGRLVMLDRRLRPPADVPGEVDDADREVGAHELDPDRIARVGVDAQRALAAATAARVLDHGLRGDQPARDVRNGLERQPGRGRDRRPPDRAAGAHEVEDDHLVVILDAGEIGPPFPRPALSMSHVRDDTH